MFSYRYRTLRGLEIQKSRNKIKTRLYYNVCIGSYELLKAWDEQNFIYHGILIFTLIKNRALNLCTYYFVNPYRHLIEVEYVTHGIAWLTIKFTKHMLL